MLDVVEVFIYNKNSEPYDFFGTMICLIDQNGLSEIVEFFLTMNKRTTEKYIRYYSYSKYVFQLL